MNLQFIRDAGRYKQGDLRDWPLPTWNQLADNLGLPLEKVALPPEQLGRRHLAGGNAAAPQRRKLKK